MTYWDPKYESAREPQLSIPELTEDDVKVILANVIRQRTMAQQSPQLSSDAFTLVSYEARQATDVRHSHNLRVYQLKVNFQLYNVCHQTKLILKLQNQASSQQKNTSKSQRQLFVKEILFYGCIIPKMKEFMPSNLSILPVPECYLAKSNESSLYQASHSSPCCFLPGAVDMLVLEDVMRGGGGFHPVSNYFDAAHLKLVLKSVAELHALSVVLDRRGTSHNVSISQMFPALTEETLYNKHANADWYDRFTAALEIFSVIGPAMSEKSLLPNRDISKVVTVMMNGLWDILEDSLKPSTTHINTLCLNSCDLSSFVFSYDDQMNPKECKILNYQHVKYSRPIIDLVQIFYSCAQEDVRSSNDNFNYLIEFYHNEFLETVSKCHQKYHPSLPLPKGLLSLSELKETYHECRVLGVARRAIVAAFGCLIEQEDPYECRSPPTLMCAEEAMLAARPLPPRAELRARAAKAFEQNGHYKASMYLHMSKLLECIAETVNCGLIRPHSGCPHPSLL